MKIKLVLFLILLPVLSFTQQEEMGWDAKFAIGIGYTPGWFIPDYNIINDQVKALGVDEFSSAGFFATGYSGYVSVAVVKNIRIGGMHLNGSTSNKGYKNGFNKEAVYSASLSGLTIEYSLPFIKQVAVSVGTIIGAGNATLELYQNKGEFQWNGIWNELDGTKDNTTNISRKLSNTFFTISPTLNVDIPFYRFFAFRIGGGYMFALGKNWEVDNGVILNDIPSGLSSNSLFLQVGIYVGYFNY